MAAGALRRAAAAAVVLALAAGVAGCTATPNPAPAGGNAAATGFAAAGETRWSRVTFELGRAAYDEEQAIARDPRWAAPHARLAQIFAAQGDTAAALAEAATAARLDPKHPLYADDWGDLARRAGDLALAERAYEAARRADPADWQAAWGLGLVAVARRQWGPAARWLRLALLLGGPRGTVDDAFGQLYAASGDVPEAAAYFAAAVAADPGWWQPYYDRAALEARLGQRAAALADLRRALARQPASGVAFELYRKLAQPAPTP
jgi:tetratricopeptide (TPR) repeat protein